MANVNTGKIKTADGKKLFYRCWPGKSNRPVLLFVHGLGEHSGRYRHPVAFFGRLGYTMYAYDQRGHGRSEGRRAYAERFARLLGDLEQVLGFIKKREGKKKVILVGHSFGGQVALTYASRHPNGISGLITSSANIRLRMPVPYLKKKVGRLLAYVIPTFTMNSGIEPSYVSHDPKEVEAFEKDPLINKEITVRMADLMFDNQDRLLAIARQVKVPCLLMHGTEDPISDPKGSEDFYRACSVKDKQLKLYPGLYHELFNEIDKLTVFRDMREWIEARV